MLQIAQQVGVARNTAQARLDRLLARGVIVGFGPDIALRQVGYTVSAFVNLEVSQPGESDVDEALLAIPEIVEAYMTTGPSDLVCRVVAYDNDHLGQLLSQILAIPGVSRVTSSLVLATRIAPRVLPLITD